MYESDGIIKYLSEKYGHSSMAFDNIIFSFSLVFSYLYVLLNLFRRWNSSFKSDTWSTYG